MSQATYNAHETVRMHALHGRQLASFHSRAIAFLIDLAVGGILFLAISLAVVYAKSGSLTFHVSGLRIQAFERVGPPRNDINIRLTFFKNWYGLIWWVVYFGLVTYVGKGRTLAKWLLNIRVISLVRERLSLWHSVERALGYGASALEFGFGFAQHLCIQTIGLCTIGSRRRSWWSIGPFTLCTNVTSPRSH